MIRQSIWNYFLLIYILPGSYSFLLQQPLSTSRPQVWWPSSTVSSSYSSALHSDKLKRDIEERSQKRAADKGVGGSIAAGAVLGGLIAGPFGALWGASIGSSLGVKSALDKSKKEEMERLGITQEMLDAAEDVALALQQSMEGMEATKESLQTHQSLARRIDSDASELYEKAKNAMTDGNEEEARKFLLKRTTEQESLKKVLQLCAEEKKRLEIMEDNVKQLQKRAMEVEGLLQRTVGAKTRRDSFTEDLSMSTDDPLLQKFRDLGID
jgi:hypothetical protein